MGTGPEQEKTRQARNTFVDTLRRDSGLDRQSSIPELRSLMEDREEWSRRI